MDNKFITFLTTQLNRLEGPYLAIALIGIVPLSIYFYNKFKNNPSEKNRIEVDSQESNHNNYNQGNNNKLGHNYGSNNDFGSNNSFGDTNTYNYSSDPITTHIHLNKEIDEKIIAFGNYFEALMKQSNINYSDIDKLKNQFFELLRSIDAYVTSMKNRNIITDIEIFYDSDLIKIFELTKCLNIFIENSSLNISKISKNYLESFLPKDESVTKKYSEIMEQYNNL